MKAIVFDFDGTIVDTETAWYVAYREVFVQHGAELTLTDYAQIVGTQYDFAEHLQSVATTPIDRAAVEHYVEQRYQELAQTQAVRPGIREMIAAAKAQGLRIGLASSSGRAWVEEYLRRFGLLEAFECLFTKEDVEQVKPHPALYQKAIAALGVEPHEALALEDSPNGARAAKAAGLHCVIVPNELTCQFAFPAYDLRIDAPEELDLTRLVAKLLAGGKAQ